MSTWGSSGFRNPMRRKVERVLARDQWSSARTRSIVLCEDATKLSSPRTRSTVFENQRALRADVDALPGALFVFGLDLVRLQNRIAVIIERKQVRVDGVTLA